MTKPCQQIEQPLFIVGPLRSGTTLLRLMLDHHPQIRVFGEFEYAVAAARGDAWPLITDYHDWLKTERMFQDVNLEINPNLDYHSLVHDFFRQHASRTSKPMVGATIHSRIDLIPKLWPHARYIHLLRDPRDVARSTIGMGWTGHVERGINYWIHTEEHWDILCQQTISEQRYEIRYENLIRSTEYELTNLCAFLGFEFDPAMLEFCRNTTYQPPDPSLTEQWRRKMTPREIALVEIRAGDLLSRRGYEASGHPLTPPGFLERLSLTLINRWNLTGFAIKRYGLSLWLQRLILKRFGSSTARQRLSLRLNEIDRQHLR
ncbi:MAG: sulfotransferase [Phycisphaeraceae bacterium]